MAEELRLAVEHHRLGKVEYRIGIDLRILVGYRSAWHRGGDSALNLLGATEFEGDGVVVGRGLFLLGLMLELESTYHILHGHPDAAVSLGEPF